MLLAYKCAIGIMRHAGDGPVIDVIEYPMFLFALGMTGFFNAVHQEHKQQKQELKPANGPQTRLGEFKRAVRDVSMQRG